MSRKQAGFAQKLSFARKVGCLPRKSFRGVGELGKIPPGVVQNLGSVAREPARLSDPFVEIPDFQDVAASETEEPGDPRLSQQPHFDEFIGH